MAEVHIIDIDSERWDIKDLSLTERVATLEEKLVTKELPQISIRLKTGYTAVATSASAHYGFSKIHFIYFYFNNLKGSNIGSSSSAIVASVDLHPKMNTYFFMSDGTSGKTLRCSLSPNGDITIWASSGVSSGNNKCYGELIFAEA